MLNVKAVQHLFIYCPPFSFQGLSAVLGMLLPMWGCVCESCMDLSLLACPTKELPPIPPKGLGGPPSTFVCLAGDGFILGMVWWLSFGAQC